MDEKAIYEQYGAIRKLLNARRLKEALAQLQAFAQQVSLYDITSRCETIATSYRYMLQYMGEGAPDPERINMYNQLIAQTYDLNEQAIIAVDDSKSNRYYFQNRRSYILSAKAPRLSDTARRLESYTDDIALSELISDGKRREIIDRNEVALKDMFMTVWCNSRWSGEEAELASSMLSSQRIDINALCLMVSAVTLSVMECLDLRKVEWLCDAYQHEESHVSQRALVGIAVTALTHSERLSVYPSLSARLKMLADTTNFSADMTRLYLQLLLCQETEKIGMQMREEIMPEVMKKATKLTNIIKEIENDEEEEMPEWEELLNDSNVEKNILKLNELQSEGADVQMTSFCTLKSFTYFNEMHHWLYPFDYRQQEVTRLSGDKKEPELDFMLNSGTFCDSDKYSFFFMYMNMVNGNQKSMFVNMHKSMPGDISDEVRDHIKEITANPANICNNYLHDLYRFFNLYFYRAEFKNIFAKPIELHRDELLKPYIYSEPNLAALASYHLKKEHWTTASEIIREILKMGESLSTKAETYQRLGFALQKSKDIEAAIEAYTTADTIKPNTLWTDKRLATCYRLIRDYERALKLYREIDEGGNGNANITYYMGSSLVELNRFGEALNIFFKLDFSEEESVRAWRGIAWCSFMTGKYEQAMKYYRKVIELKPTTQEYMNAGHVAWCMGDMKTAVGYYRKVADDVATKDELIALFEKEKSYLMERGIASDEIALMVDLLY